MTRLQTHALWVIILLSAVVGLAGCGDDDNPTGPFFTEPPDIAGTWFFTETVQNDDCFIDRTPGQVVTSTITITQSGSNITMTSQDTAIVIATATGTIGINGGFVATASSTLNSNILFNQTISGNAVNAATITLNGQDSVTGSNGCSFFANFTANR